MGIRRNKMLIKDNNEIAEIELIGRNGIDWTRDFFNAGTMEQDEEDGAYIVDSIQDCLDAVMDYCSHEGDYADITDDETRAYLGGRLYAIAGTRVFLMTEKLSHSGETIDIETEPCHDPDEATIKAERDWNHLAESDKKRTVISVILAAPDESGKHANLDSWETLEEYRLEEKGRIL